MMYDDEAETLVRSKEMADAILRELSPRLPPPASPADAVDIVVLPPPARTPSGPIAPWPSVANPKPGAALKTVLSQQKLYEQRRRRRQEGTKLHWAVFAMTAAIAVGLWFDPVARVRVFAQARATTAHVMAKLPHR